MRRFLCLALLLAACGGSRRVVKVHVLAINDFHGNLETPARGVRVRDPSSGAPVEVRAGGAEGLGAALAELKSRGEPAVIVAAGDLVSASPLESALFHDEPSIEALSAMGLELSAVGNHEFDFGKQELLRKQRGGCFPPAPDGRSGVPGKDTCLDGGRFAGARFQYLAANVIDEETHAPLLPAYAVRELGGVRIGFIGMTLRETPSVVTPTGVAGLSFDDEADTVNRLVPGLERQGVHAIVVLVHQGGRTRATAIDDHSCPGFEGEILRILDRLSPKVAVVVSGHTHEEYVCRYRSFLVTQTGSYGRVVSDIALTLDPEAGTVLDAQAHNVPVRPDRAFPPVQPILARTRALVGPLAAARVGSLESSIARQADANGDSPLGALVADAWLEATSGPSFARPAQLALVNPGGVRADLSLDEAAGAVTFRMLFSVSPFNNALVTMDLTGAQLRRLLEQQWERPSPGSVRWPLHVSHTFSYAWDPAQPENAPAGQGRRVIPESMTLNGQPVRAEATYRVTVSSFLAAGGDNFTVLRDGTNRQAGPQDLDALLAYTRAHSPLRPPLPGRVRRAPSKREEAP